MSVYERFLKTIATMSIISILAIFFVMANRTAITAETTKILDPGSSWVVNETTNLRGLKIAGGAIRASEGYSLTMTVDGVETAIKPGEYRGKIVLTPTKVIMKEDPSHGLVFYLRTGIYIENGKYIPEKSVSAAVIGGTVTGTSIKDVKITSIGEEFNGILATSDTKSTLTIINPVINLTGNGADDFAGVGAAIASSGEIDVTVNNAKIITNGCARTAIWIGGSSTMHVNDSYIEAGSPPLPEGYKDVFTEGGKKFLRVPFMLGLAGTCRATNIVEKAKASSYTNSHIKAVGWGALSMDGGDNTILTVTKCTIETIESGYGVYCQHPSKFSGCTFNVADMAMIGAGGSGVFTDGTVVNSRRFGIMCHGSSDITIDKGSVFNTKSTAIELKSSGSNIVVDNAQLNAENGIIIQTMKDDDPNKSGAWSIEGGGSEAIEAGKADIEGGASATLAPPMSSSQDVNATFSNTVLKGDIVNGNTALGAITVNFKDAAITGAITTATVTNALGPNGEKITMQTPHLYKLIGEVKNTYCATDHKYGVTVSLDANSKWVVDKTSYLTGLTVSEGSVIAAPQGYSLSMTVDGIKTAINAGEYKGKIVLTVK